MKLFLLCFLLSFLYCEPKIYGTYDAIEVDSVFCLDKCMKTFNDKNYCLEKSIKYKCYNVDDVLYMHSTLISRDCFEYELKKLEQKGYKINYKDNY